MVTPEQRRTLIERQIAEWEEVRYSAEVAHRVHTRLKSGDAALEKFASDMAKAEYAIDELQKMLRELGHAAPPV